MRDLHVEVRPLLERMPCPRDESALVAFNMGKCSEAIELQFKNSVWMIEPFRHLQERHRAEPHISASQTQVPAASVVPQS